MPKIYLPNRYDDINYLEYLDGNTYQLVLENKVPLTTWSDLIYGIHIDPSGGPILRKGYCIENIEISRIYFKNSLILLDVEFNDL